MHGGRQIVIPLLQLKEFDQYTTTHSMNVAVLTMALAESRGLSARDVRSFGVAGLDRKSTRLNSSHLVISYAVFCLKKKTKLADELATARAEVRDVPQWTSQRTPDVAALLAAIPEFPAGTKIATRNAVQYVLHPHPT